MQESDTLSTVLIQDNDLIIIYNVNDFHFWRYNIVLGEWCYESYFLKYCPYFQFPLQHQKQSQFFFISSTLLTGARALLYLVEENSVA